MNHHPSEAPCCLRYAGVRRSSSRAVPVALPLATSLDATEGCRTLRSCCTRQRRLARRLLASLHDGCSAAKQRSSPFAMEPIICRSSSTSSHDIVGAYTPVTKRLWVERLNLSSKTVKEAPLAQATVPKPPNPIAITYPFSTDKALAEMVGRIAGLVDGHQEGSGIALAPAGTSRHQQAPAGASRLCRPRSTCVRTTLPAPAPHAAPWRISPARGPGAEPGEPPPPGTQPAASATVWPAGISIITVASWLPAATLCSTATPGAASGWGACWRIWTALRATAHSTTGEWWPTPPPTCGTCHTCINPAQQASTPEGLGQPAAGRWRRWLQPAAGGVKVSTCFSLPAQPPCSHQDGYRPPLLVTASVDAIELARPLDLNLDMTITGQVVWLWFGGAQLL
jgi:hypothetical protein